MISDEIKNVCFKTITQHSYSLRTENITLALVSDPRPSIRCDGINRSIHTRTTKRGRKNNSADAGNLAYSNISETIYDTKKFYIEFIIFHDIFKNS